MPTIREAELKRREELKKNPPPPKKPNKMNPAYKYLDMESFFQDRDVGAKGDPVSDSRVLFTAYDVEFLVEQKYLSNPNLLRNPNMRKFLKEVAARHKSRTMYICVGKNGSAGVFDFFAEKAIINKEEFHLNGVDVMMEKGAYDRNDPQDIAWLYKMTERFKNQRILLCPHGAETINELAEAGYAEHIFYQPE